MYKRVEKKWKKLLSEGKEYSPEGECYLKIMDYWWDELTQEEKKMLLSETKDLLEKTCAEVYAQLFPDEKLK